MPLQSQLFRGDPLLEAAAVYDSAHIVPGAVGPHVGKIQLALNQVDDAAIAQDGVYGPATAAAVLVYKQERNIVNYTYQTQADNIVGKMTMAALDRELLDQDMKPVGIRSIFPLPVPPVVYRRGLMLAFGIEDGGVPAPAPPFNLPATRWAVPAWAVPVMQPVVVEPQQPGSIEATGGVGGYLARWQPPRQATDTPIVALLNGTNRRNIGPRWEAVDIDSDPQLFNYVAGELCGETRFQVVNRSKASDICVVLVLVRRSSYPPMPVYPADSRFKSALLSTEGTPLNPLPGRKINIFGRGESNGFDDYSTSIRFCNDSNMDGGKNPWYKPWTDDPRKPDPGIPDKSVNNICCRNSPIYQVTIDEMKRIAAPGCRVTFAGDRSFVDVLRATFVGTGLAKKPIDEGPCGGGFGGFAIIFELN